MAGIDSQRSAVRRDLLDVEDGELVSRKNLLYREEEKYEKCS